MLKIEQRENKIGKKIDKRKRNEKKLSLLSAILTITGLHPVALT